MMTNVKDSILSMHTRLDIDLMGEDTSTMKQAVFDIKDLLHSAEMLLSCHNPDALAAKINHYNPADKLTVPTEFFEVLEQAKEYYNKSGKLFDITLGSGAFLFEENLSDFPENIAQHTSTPFHLDFGGFGKGYALEKIRKLLLHRKIEHAFLSFGGTSVLCLGQNKKEQARNYALPEYPHIKFRLNNESVSVSSNYNPSGETNHIIYPDTFKPASNNIVAAAKCKNALDAEILSTSLILCEMSKFQSLLNQFPESEAYIIDKIEPHNFLYLTSEKN